jgi:Alpha/beta hydrolase of unknown function (DUF1400)
LQPLLNSIEQKDRQQIRQFFKIKSEFSSLQVSQFLHSAIGEKILVSLGDVVQANRDLNGAQELRTWLTLAASNTLHLNYQK